MANLLPTPVAAVLGLGATVVSGFLRLPRRTLRLPIVAVSSALSTMDHLRSEYDDLAERGERLVRGLRGRAVTLPGEVAGRADGLEDRLEDLVQRTPFAGAYDRVEDALEDAVDRGRQAVNGAATALRGAGQAAGQAAAQTSEAAAGAATRTAQAVASAGTTAAAAAEPSTAEREVPEDERPKGVPTPKATEPDSTRIGTAASASTVEAVEQAVEELAAEAADEPLPHDELPLPDYDHMTLGSLRGRLRSLSVEQLVQLRTYEKAHADRLPVVTMLDNRIAKLASEGTEPAGTPSTAPAPEQLAAAQAGGGGSKVSPATTGPKINPPSQGDPTNPTQPRSTG